MIYDKTTADGRVIKAPSITYRVLDSVPILFQIAEWLLVIVAFQYVDVRFGYVAAKVAWIVLAGALALYMGVLVSNVTWRFFEDPYKNRAWRLFSYGLLPLVSGGLVFLLLKVVAKQMVAAQAGAA
ncbi:hypothetical protein [Luteimonas sp. SDU101]|uniref:hypothetical protein n=1 Tax=Luteimonas sp. SDU101 TaxID=3422593 RepID=UPI003EBDC1AD